MSKVVYIYGLQDPRNCRIRYVGAANDPFKRFEQHLDLIDYEHRGGTAAKRAWLSDLRDAGLKPWLVILEKVKPGKLYPAGIKEKARDAERAWISQLAAAGHDLTNREVVVGQKRGADLFGTLVLEAAERRGIVGIKGICDAIEERTGVVFKPQNVGNYLTGRTKAKAQFRMALLAAFALDEQEKREISWAFSYNTPYPKEAKKAGAPVSGLLDKMRR